jgi:hypothetical protein
MDYQAIRKYYEYAVIDCCNLARIEYRGPNSLEPGGDAYHEYAVARLQFGTTARSTVGCGPVPSLSAVFIVEYFGPKGTGPADAQDFMECVVCKMHDMKGVTDIQGPTFGELDNRPYYFASVSFSLVIPTDLE